MRDFIKLSHEGKFSNNFRVLINFGNKTLSQTGTILDTNNILIQKQSINSLKKNMKQHGKDEPFTTHMSYNP